MLMIIKWLLQIFALNITTMYMCYNIWHLLVAEILLTWFCISQSIENISMECNSMKYLVWKSYSRGKINSVHNENIQSLWKFSNLCCPVTTDVIKHASSHNARFIWMWSYEYSYWYVCLVSNDSCGKSRPDGSFPGCILLISNMECIWWREFTWWCHDMEMFSKLLALCEWIPLVICGFPSQEASNAELLYMAFLSGKQHQTQPIRQSVTVNVMVFEQCK